MAITRLGPNQDITAAKIAGQINFKNLIINGDMSIAQRGTSKAGVNTSEYNSVDRFEFGVGNTFATFTTSQDTDSPNEFSYSAKLDCTTSGSVGSTGFTRIRHKIEGQFLQSLAFGTSDAKAITLSFYIKSNQTGNFVVNFRNFNSSQQRCANKIVTINSANTWEYKSMTVSGDTVRSIDNNNGYEFSLEFWFNGGSSYTSGTTSASFIDQPGDNFFSGGTLSIGGSTDDYVNLTGVQLEADTSASDFEFLPYDVNLQRCQRYYQKSYNDLTYPGQVSDNGAVFNRLENGGVDNRAMHVPFKCRMRNAPTVTTYDTGGTPSSGSYADYGVDFTRDGTKTTTSVQKVNQYGFAGIVAGGGPGEIIAFQFTADAEL